MLAAAAAAAATPRGLLEAHGAAYMADQFPPHRDTFSREEVVTMLRTIDQGIRELDKSSFDPVAEHIRDGQKLLASKALPAATAEEEKQVGTRDECRHGARGETSRRVVTSQMSLTRMCVCVCVCVSLCCACSGCSAECSTSASRPPHFIPIRRRQRTTARTPPTVRAAAAAKR
jgi:hypothetical protein